MSGCMALLLLLLLTATASSKPATRDSDLVPEYGLQERPVSTGNRQSEVIRRRSVSSDASMQVPPRHRRGFDTLTGASFGHSKRAKGFDSVNGISFGSQKRSYNDQVSRELLEETHSRNFNNVGGKNYDTFYKENVDESSNNYNYPNFY